jgi:5,10-methylene-tetrahydrofolate dehydrogenase/methenyl tetrahydrofolate cyclohydrolase/dephospho-CoA kinase
VHGILVQLPLPPQIDASRVLLALDPDKDVDGFHPVNAGRLLIGLPGLVPCTPAGIVELLLRNHIPLEGRHAVIIGRSNIVGKPLAVLLLRHDCTVTICHSRTRDLPAIASQADILVAAIGKLAMVTGDFVKPGAAVVDVGMNVVKDEATCLRLFGEDEARLKAVRTRGSTLAGDVHRWRSAPGRAGSPPVPGGVGPLTIAMLLKNTLDAAPERGRLTGKALRVGLTGGIASGKTTVALTFRRLGAVVLDADVLAHALLEPGGAAYDAVVARFGPEILDAERRIERPKLAAIVFSDARRGPTWRRSCTRASSSRRAAPGLRAGAPAGPIAVVERRFWWRRSYTRFDRLVLAACSREAQMRRLTDRGLTRGGPSPGWSARVAGRREGRGRFCDRYGGNPGADPAPERTGLRRPGGRARGPRRGLICTSSYNSSVFEGEPMLKSLRSWIDNGAHTVSPDMDAQPGVDWVRVIPFLFVHLACLAVIWVGWSPIAVAVGIGLYLLRAFFVTGFYHRYFSHRTFKTSRPMQFVFALAGNSAVQRGRCGGPPTIGQHHRTSDQEGGSPLPARAQPLLGHMGWITSHENFRTRLELVPDLAKYPELRWLDRFDSLVPLLYGVFTFGLGAVLGKVAPVPGHQRAADADLGLLHLHRHPLPRHLPRELRRAPGGTAALQDHRREPQQPRGGAPHHGRGLAQQPPPLPRRHAAGLLLVGDRHHLRPAQGHVVDGSDLGAVPGAAQGAGAGKDRRSRLGRAEHHLHEAGEALPESRLAVGEVVVERAQRVRRELARVAPIHRRVQDASASGQAWPRSAG